MFSTNYASTFRVLTYNIRYDAAEDGVNRWKHRKHRLFRLLEQYQPDLFGVQEARPHQIADLNHRFPNFGWYGINNRGDLDAIFYRLDLFELRDRGTFWLSQTPDIPGSKGWDATNTYVCNWVKLKHRPSRRIVYHFNTHFDHAKMARLQSARLILARIRAIAGLTVPVILTGDFNSVPKSDAYHAIVTNTMLRDAKFASKSPHRGPHGTWATFHVDHGIGSRMDYIFVSSYLNVLQHEHITYSENSYYPSDHLPVLSVLTFKHHDQCTQNRNHMPYPFRYSIY